MKPPERIGVVSHYYNHLSVAVVRLERYLSERDVVHFIGAHTNFSQRIKSMQVEYQPISDARAGEVIALKVRQRVPP